MFYSKYIRKDANSLENGTNNELQVNVDDLSIERSTSGIRVKSTGINSSHLNLGTGVNQIDALDIPINDTTNLFSIDNIEAAVTQVASKMVLYKHTIPSFTNVTPVAVNGATTSISLDVDIKSIIDDNNGGGNSTTVGVILDATRNYEIPLRHTSSGNPIDDASGNEVYARLSFTGSPSDEYVVSYYSLISGTETPYTGFLTTNKIDFAYVLFSQKLINLPWADTFVGDSWQDIAGITSNIQDDNVDVNGMSGLLTGATTQAQANTIIDKLANTTLSEGVSMLGIHDAGGFFTLTTQEGANTELAAAIGGTNSTTRDFTENNVVTDNDNLTIAINKLDVKFGDLASTLVNEGASLISINDPQSQFIGTTVEEALTELSINKRNIKTFYFTLSATDISNSYIQLTELTNGTVVNNNVTLNVSSLDIIEGCPALFVQFKIMRNDAGMTDFLVWKTSITCPGCTYASTGINSTEFGDLLETNETLRLTTTI